MKATGWILLALVLAPPALRADPSAAAGDEAAPADEPTFEMVVEGRRPVSRDATEDATTVPGAHLRDSPRAGLFDALSEATPGMYVSSHGLVHGVASGATGAVHIRGLGGSPNAQVLVVEDGAPDYQGIFGHPIPDAYAPLLVDEALVVRGGDSVLFGTNAMGGAIVLRSRWRATDGYELQSDAAYGSYGTLRGSATLLARAGAFDVAGALTALSTDGHRQGAGGRELVAHTAARYRITPDLSVSVRNKVVHLEGADPGPVSHPYADHTYDVWRDSASVRLEWRADPLRLAVTPYLNVGWHRLYDGFRSTDYVGGGTAELDAQVHRTTALLVGIGAAHVDGEVDNRVTGERLPVEGLTDVALYGQVTVRPIAALTLVAGAREVYSTRYGFVFLGKAGLRWDIGGGFSAHTRVTRNFRQPTLRELYLPFPTANPELAPEYALNADVGLAYESRHVEVACSAYRTEADDLIRYFGVWPAAEVVNVDHVVLWGLEGRVALKRLGPVSLSVNGNWQAVGRYTRQNPAAKLDVTLAAGQAFGAHFVGGSLTAEWVHGLFMGDYGRHPIADAFAMDLALRYRYTAPDRGVALEPYLFVRNVLDRTYAFVDEYPMPGLHVLFGLKVSI